MTTRVLIVDDDPEIIRMLSHFLKGEGFSVSSAQTAQEAVAVMRQVIPDIVLLDLVLPDSSGLALLKEHILPGTGRYRVIMLTGRGTPGDVYEAVLLGAFDYLTKPVSLPRLKVSIQNCLRLQELEHRLQELSGGTIRPISLRDLIGTSPQMRALVEQVKRVAPFDVPVLILGESGTGKELVARALHALSQRAKGPFVPIDCAALPDTLIEAEVFGYERGAFTGAVQTKPGKLERANGGTVFWDEIGNIPPSIQPKLLRVLQEQSVEHLGGKQETPINVRIISATNADMVRMVEEGSFRRDLYHRLNTVVLHVPPLRARAHDIPLLAHYFLMMANRAYNLNVRGISSGAMAALQANPWPGNVRELENCIRSAVIMAGRVIETGHLPFQFREEGSPAAVQRSPLQNGESLAQIRRRGAEEAERAAIAAALEETGNNKAEAARRLRVDYKSLYLKMRYYGIQPGKRDRTGGAKTQAG